MVKTKKKCDKCGLMRNELYFRGCLMVCGKCSRGTASLGNSVGNENKSKEGYKICPAWLRESYIRAVKFTCSSCHKKFEMKDFEIHRITPGHKGGLYIPSNCQVLCIDCHKLRAERW